MDTEYVEFKKKFYDYVNKNLKLNIDNSCTYNISNPIFAEKLKEDYQQFKFINCSDGLYWIIGNENENDTS